MHGMKPLRCGLLFLALAWGIAAPVSATREARPNIIVVMVDDMGFSDPGCFGGEIETPNLDALAANGLRFTQFYNASRCCPTRAALMTGQYPHQVGLAVNGRSLTRNGLTIAEALKPAGYQTAMVGKWHLSKTPVLPKRHQDWIDHRHDPGQPFGPPDTYPVRRGFDRHYGIIWGVINYFDPFSLVDGMKAVQDVPEDYYITDAITEKAVEYIRTFDRGKPFFLYVAHCAPHWPLHAREEDIRKYEGKYAAGWGALRRARYKRQLEMGLFDKATAPLPPLDGRGPGWDQLEEKQRAFLSAKMAVHAAMVDRVDQGLGKILKTLREVDAWEDTMILFLSDNGASPEIPIRPGYDRSALTRDGKKIRYKGFDRPGSETTYTGIGPRWASAVNTPFRYWKKESYEGGCHTPCIVHWPRGLKTKPGSLCDAMGHVIDVMPTCLELAGVDYPKEHDGHTLTPIEGKSLVPLLQGKPREGHAFLGFEHVGGRAIREGDWKLTALKGEPWRLFDIKRDRTETRDLAAQHPDRVKALTAKWEAWAKRVGVIGKK